MSINYIKNLIRHKIMMKSSFIALVWILAIATIAQAQSQASSEAVRPLVLITSLDHSIVKSIDQLNKLIPSIPNLKAITFNTDKIELAAKKLRQLVQQIKINKQKVSSLQVTRSQIKKIQGIIFKQVSSIEEVKKVLEQSDFNILLEIVWDENQPRLLSETHEQVIPTPKSQEPEQRSQLFANMDSVTLTGLLVSLFLIIILLIAVNCLYEIKTNDQFGRTNLWVGKES